MVSDRNPGWPMSDSEGKKLAGIARSIDALFEPKAPEEDDPDAGVESSPEPPNVEGDALTGAPVPPDMPEREDELPPPEAVLLPDAPEAGPMTSGSPTLSLDPGFEPSTADDVTPAAEHEGPTEDPAEDPAALAADAEALQDAEAFVVDPEASSTADLDASLEDVEASAADPDASPSDLEALAHLDTSLADLDASLEDADASLEDADAPVSEAASSEADPSELGSLDPSVTDSDAATADAPASTEDPEASTTDAVTAPAPPRPAAEGEEAEEGVPATPLELAVDAWVDGERSNAEEIRRLAAEALERRELDPVARSVGRLASAAGDPPDESTLALAESMSSPVVLSRLARQIGVEYDEERRREHYLACRNLGEPMAVAIRDDLAESTDRHARRVHCEALVEMGPVGRAMIEEMAEDENRFLARNAIAILGEIGGEGAVELVRAALANPDPRVRREALRSLVKLGDQEAGDFIYGLLDDSDERVRIAAAVAAGELRVERGLRAMTAMLDETGDPDVAIPVIRALGHLGDPGAVPAIEKWAVRSLFSKPPTEARIAAYGALHHIGTPHARQLLEQALEDKDPEVKAAVEDITRA